MGRLIALFALVALNPGRASAQEIFPRIHLGQPEAEAVAAFGGASPIDYPLRAGATVSAIYGQPNYIMFCRGRVDVMERTVGSTVSTFAGLAAATIRERGQPEAQVSYQTGELHRPWVISTVGLYWDDLHANARYTIEMLETGGLFVRERVSSIDNDCPKTERDIDG